MIEAEYPSKSRVETRFKNRSTRVWNSISNFGKILTLKIDKCSQVAVNFEVEGLRHDFVFISSINKRVSKIQFQILGKYGARNTDKNVLKQVQTCLKNVYVEISFTIRFNPIAFLGSFSTQSVLAIYSFSVIKLLK